jgi:hypothetical protein
MCRWTCFLKTPASIANFRGGTLVKDANRQKGDETMVDTNLSLRLDRGLKKRKATALSDALAATERIWQNAARNGTDKMSLEEIDEEVAAARAERRTRRTGA